VTLRRAFVAAATAALLCGSVLGAPVAGATFADRFRTYTIPGEFVYPEGVTVRPGTHRFFVGATNGGTVFSGRLERRAMRPFLPAGANGLSFAVGMKATRSGLLYVTGGPTGTVFVYDVATRELVRKFSNGLSSDQTFLNDVIVARNGDAYVTDSLHPVLYKIPAGAVEHSSSSTGTLRSWRDLTGSAIRYRPGFNLNGIEISRGGRFLFTVHSVSGSLFRVNVRNKRIREVPLAGGNLVNGDGLELKGHRLFAVRNSDELLVKVSLSRNLTSGKIRCTRTYPSFAFPTTVARVAGRLLVVNSQFDNAQPDLPFTVSNVAVPKC
jgi:WD40 repeat protein